MIFSLSENQSKVLLELLIFLESYIGKEGVKDIILNKPASFRAFRVKTQKNPNSLDKAYILQMPLVVKYLESYLNREVVQEMMKNSFYGLAIAEFKKLEEVVKYIERYFETKSEGRKVVQKIMKKSFQGLASADPEKLKNILGYIEKYTKEENERKIVIQQIMSSINLFATRSDFEEKSRDFIFNKLNDLLKSIDESIESTKYNKEQRTLWKERLQNIFLKLFYRKS